jgi:hypothetical protein
MPDRFFGPFARFISNRAVLRMVSEEKRKFSTSNPADFSLRANQISDALGGLEGMEPNSAAYGAGNDSHFAHGVCEKSAVAGNLRMLR